MKTIKITALARNDHLLNARKFQQTKKKVKKQRIGN